MQLNVIKYGSTNYFVLFSAWFACQDSYDIRYLFLHRTSYILFEMQKTVSNWISELDSEINNSMWKYTIYTHSSIDNHL